MLLSFQRGLYEGTEERVRRKRARTKLGMELCTKHEWMLLFRQLRDLHETPVGRNTRKHKTRFRKAFDVFRIYLVSVTVSFGDRCFPIGFACDRSFHEIAWVCAETHRAAKILSCQF